MELIKNKLKGLGMSQSTIKTYSSILKNFFEYIKKVNNIVDKEINEYLDYLMVTKNYCGRSRNLVMKVIKFYMREFNNIEINIKKAKETKPIPKICWDNDLKQIISVTPNIKHRLCILLMRYSGLRKFEAIHLMKHHVLDNGMVFVKQGKGQKDRYSIIPPQILEQLKSYMSLLPTDNPYIFQGQNSKHYSSRTPQEILNNAFRKLKWHKERWFGCHALRHAFCIYCLDNKIGDYDQVSKWLGHSVRQTTQIYTRCRKIDYVESIMRYKTITCIIQ